MKGKFSALDVVAIVAELKAKLCTGWRVNQVYDCDNKTYLFKLNKSIIQMKKDEDITEVDEKVANKLTFIVESGVRIHTTEYNWVKSHAPSNFAVKLRKHLRNKRIVNIKQVGYDRLIEIQFGTGEVTFHLIVELYDKGNLILTDYQHTILTVLRWRKPTQRPDDSLPLSTFDSENLKVGSTYSFDSKQTQRLDCLNDEPFVDVLNHSRQILSIRSKHKKKDKQRKAVHEDFFEVNLKDLFTPHASCGSNLFELMLHEYVFDKNPVVKNSCVQLKIDGLSFDQKQVVELASKIRKSILEANKILDNIRIQTQIPGFIIQKVQDATIANNISRNEKDTLVTNLDFFPLETCAKRQLDISPVPLTLQEYDSFDRAVDIYYSNLEGQRLDNKAVLVEREALKKLENLKLDQQKRLDELASSQIEDAEKGRLIENNCDKVESALMILRSMVASEMPWDQIWTTVKEAQAKKDPIAILITSLKLERNGFCMKLCDPFEEPVGPNKKPIYKVVDIDLSLSAFANARKFFSKRRTAVNKEQKTKEISKKAYKNVEKITREKLKEVAIKTSITKARRRYWFENFHWFLSSEGYLVVAGRDAEQNDLLVKRYMKNNDIYVHADLHGAATVIVKNEFPDKPIPPKTITEAGTMAVCYSSAWDAKIAITSWWVYSNQVSKSAPTGEYLTTGSFMIRGKKNYLPISYLVLGFGFIFKLDDESIEKRISERLKRQQIGIDKENATLTSNIKSESNFEKPLAATTNEIDLGGSNKNEQDSHDEDEEVEPMNKFGVSNLSKSTANLASSDEELEDDDEDEDKKDSNLAHRLIDTITDSPTSEDILLYAIPMCGPYSAFSDFKYKVKVIPGPTKRGKAAKAVLSMFLHEKTATQREKDLLRVYKDQDFARDMPGKVKISAANLAKLAAGKKKYK